MQESGTVAEIDPRRVIDDPTYRARYARVLLDRSGRDADHVELRRLAHQVFPSLARSHAGEPLAQLVGSASTLRQSALEAMAPDVIEASLIRKPSHPLEYPPRYADLDPATRALLIRFCEGELKAGREGRDALQNLDRRHGWPYTDRTFYVGPWKAARLRLRRQDDD